MSNVLSMTVSQQLHVTYLYCRVVVYLQDARSQHWTAASTLVQGAPNPSEPIPSQMCPPSQGQSREGCARCWLPALAPSPPHPSTAHSGHEPPPPADPGL